MATRYGIVNGPGKWDLMSGLGDGKVVTFTVTGGELTPARGETMYVHLTSLEIEDGSRQSWLIKFHLVLADDPSVPSQPVGYGDSFHGYYDNTTRRGWLEEVKNQAT